jgi:hypothetical protein
MRKHTPIPKLTDKQIKRFWSKVFKGGADDCWEWAATASSNGYGVVSLNYCAFGPHRIAYFLHYGKDPGDKLVCHKCDNRLCCNPRHLFLGTQKMNVQDMWRKGRGCMLRLKGERSACSKLSESQVVAIRKSDALQRVLAKRYKVSLSLISAIKLRKRWTHI